MKITNLIITILLALLFINNNLSAQTITSAQSGNWSESSTWVGGNIPTSSNDVVIASGHTVTVNVNNAECKNVSFGATTSKLAMAEGSVLNVYGNFTLASTTHNAFSSWAEGAKIRFTGPNKQILSGWNTSTTTMSTTFMEMIVDKSADTLKTAGNDMKFNLGTSLEIINGSFVLTNTDDIQGRNLDGTLATTPTIYIHPNGRFIMYGGASHIGSGTTGTPRPPIGKVTIYGAMTVTTTSSNRINFSDIDIEQGGTLTLETGWTAYYFAPGTVTVKNGGTILNQTTTNIWATGTTVNLNTGGVYKTTSSTTIFPPTFNNSGTVKYQRTASGDQIITDMNYYRLEISFSGNNKTWTLGANRTIADSLEINNSATLVLSGTGGTPTINGVLRLTTGNLNNSTNNITLASGAEISRATGTINTAPIFGSSVNVRYTSTTTSVTTGPELPTSPTVLNNLVIISPGQTVTLGANVTVNGQLTLSSGTFDNDGAENDKILTLANGATIRRATGLLTTAPTFAGIVNLEYISTVSDVTTSFELPTSPSVLNNLTLTTTKVVTLDANATVNGTLILTNGILALGSSNLTVALISGGSASSYVATTGTGFLTRTNVGASDVLFPVGTATTYNPVTINNAGTVDNFSVRVQSTFDNQPPEPNNVVNRQWTITEAVPGGSNATITFQWNAADEASGFDRLSDIEIGRWTGTHWEGYAAVFQGGTDPYSAYVSNITQFSDFAIGNKGALPVQIAMFTGIFIEDGKVKLEWQTLSEKNNLGFYVEKFNPTINEFVTVSELIPGAGTTLQPQNYSWIDEKVIETNLQYRLKQVDMNGLYHYFGPIMLNPTGVKGNTIPAVFALHQNYPNPFNPSTKISFTVANDDYTTLKVYNLLGNLITTLYEGNAFVGKKYEIKFDAGNLPSGIYIYQLASGKNIETKKMLILK